MGSLAKRAEALEVAGALADGLQGLGQALGLVAPHQLRARMRSLVPDGVFVPREGGVHFERLAATQITGA